MSLHITRDLLDTIGRHGQDRYPEEGAGLLLGEATDATRRVLHILPVKNTFDEGGRRNRYRIDPKEMLDAELDAEQLGLEVIGVFHSHPDHSARPSEFDREWALPWYSYMITSVYGGKAIESRSWRLAEDRDQFQEETLKISSKEQESA
jgi:proteasome lid subunit RPN8/RPN11